MTETKEQIIEKFEGLSPSDQERSDLHPYLQGAGCDSSPPSSSESMPNNVSESDYHASYKNGTITLRQIVKTSVDYRSTSKLSSGGSLSAERMPKVEQLARNR